MPLHELLKMYGYGVADSADSEDEGPIAHNVSENGQSSSAHGNVQTNKVNKKHNLNEASWPRVSDVKIVTIVLFCVSVFVRRTKRTRTRGHPARGLLTAAGHTAQLSSSALNLTAALMVRLGHVWFPNVITCQLRDDSVWRAIFDS